MPLSALDLSKPWPLLADRLLISLPPGGWIDAPFTRHGGIMGYERRSPRDHRAGFDAEGAKVRILATEAFYRDDARVGDHVRRMAAEGKGSHLGPARVLELEPGSHYLGLSNTLPVCSEGQARSLGQSFVVHPDGLVITLTYVIDHQGLATHGPEEAQQLAIMLARSVTPGSRRYVRGPASVTLGRRETDALVEMDVARDWVPTLDLGPDFAAHRLFHAVPFDGTGNPSLLVYLGGHPSMRRPPNATDRAVRLLGTEARGFAIDAMDRGRRRVSVEAMAPVPGTSYACHVVAAGERPEELEAPLAMIASLYPVGAPSEATAPLPPETTAATMPKPAPSVDFDALCSAAHPSGGVGPRPAMDALWNALFDLDAWIFAVSSKDPTRPLVHRIEGKDWAFAFTDATRVKRFYEENPGPAGGAHDLFLSMPLDGARAWIRTMGPMGLFGVHFNFAQPGWFAPWANVDRIHQHLRGR